MLPWVVDVARAVRKTILTNLLWAFGYNLVALTLAALGLLQPVLAAAVMAGSSILVVLNSLRLERMPDPVRTPSSGGATKRRSAPDRFPSVARGSDRAGLNDGCQPKTSWVNAAYQPSASRTAWRRVSAFSPTLLMKMSLILIVSASALEADGVVTASSGARRVKHVLNKWGANRSDPVSAASDCEGTDLGLAIRRKGRFRHIAGVGRIADDVDAGLQLRLERHRIDRTPTRLVREARPLRQLAGHPAPG